MSGLFRASRLGVRHFAILIICSSVAGFARGAAADSIPTGATGPSYTVGVAKFTQPMPRFDVLPHINLSAHQFVPTPSEQSNTLTTVPVRITGATGFGPAEGRPPGAIWAHQGWNRFPVTNGIDVNQQGAIAAGNPFCTAADLTNVTAATRHCYNPGVTTDFNSNITSTSASPGGTFLPRFHPALNIQSSASLWTFNGTLPPKLVLGRYGEPILVREHNELPADNATGNGSFHFGHNSISTHEHNGHHGAENDGFTGAYFFPGQFYDYYWPIVLAGLNTVNTTAADRMASSPDDSGGIVHVAGDWHETMSTHWFHDHMFSFTSQNVYKGNAGMFNIYSGLDRGNEAIGAPGTPSASTDAGQVNFRLPSGSAKSFGNLEYDVNLMLADKAWEPTISAQLYFNIFNFDGFLGDRMTVNLVDNPYFMVEQRKYRFRILNASVSRFFKIALSDGSTFWQIANDGNLLPSTVPLTELDEQGIAERYDIVVDFTKYPINSKVYFVNLCEHQDGKKPSKDLSLADALAGKTNDPAVGKFLEFRVFRAPAIPDVSVVPLNMIPNPTRPAHSAARRFEFGSGGSQQFHAPAVPSAGASSTTPPINLPGQPGFEGTAFNGPWGVKTDNNTMYNADFGRVSAAPNFTGGTETWTLANGGGGWDHPVHIHFEEGTIMSRNGGGPNVVPPWEIGRKDVYRLRPSGTLTLDMQFRDWGGMFMEHCHNTVHEDNAMLVRWEIDNSGAPFMRPLPTPVSGANGYIFSTPDKAHIEKTACNTLSGLPAGVQNNSCGITP
jgi:FtsP/CotA-like multicopper oxidase with cupredoxin domain